jgi:hypothetical protein
MANTNVDSCDHKISLLLAVTLLAACIWTSLTPKNVVAGEYNLEKYMKMTDRDRAADMMLVDAQEAGIDIHHHFSDIALYGLHPCSKEVQTADGYKYSIEDSSGGMSDPDGNGIFLIQYARSISVYEHSEMVRCGITWYEHVYHSGRIISIPWEYVDTLASWEFIRWFDNYTDKYKYDIEQPNSDGEYMVLSISKDLEQGRRELEEIGLKVHWAGTRRYLLNMTQSDVLEVAKFWWVECIFRQGPPRVELESRNESPSN